MLQLPHDKTLRPPITRHPIGPCQNANLQCLITSKIRSHHRHIQTGMQPLRHDDQRPWRGRSDHLTLTDKLLETIGLAKVQPELTGHVFGLSRHILQRTPARKNALKVPDNPQAAKLISRLCPRPDDTDGSHIGRRQIFRRHGSRETRSQSFKPNISIQTSTAA